MMCLQKLKAKAEGIVQFKLVKGMSKPKRDKQTKRTNDYTSYDDHRKFKKNKHSNDRRKKNIDQSLFIDSNPFR
jgi:hypothetical protein